MKALLFDLDGTLSNNQEGIIRSIQFALSRLTDKTYADDELLWCIGPPLYQSFTQLLDTDDAELVGQAVGYFRTTFATQGIFQNKVYPGIEGLLQQLVGLDQMLFVATSKPQVYAQRIIEHFKLSDYFARIYGSELNGTRSDKGELIGYILQQEGLDSQSTVMIGDRKHDMIGAQKQSVATIGVLWGFGGRIELAACGADHLVDTPQDLLAVVQKRYGL